MQGAAEHGAQVVAVAAGVRESEGDRGRPAVSAAVQGVAAGGPPAGPVLVFSDSGLADESVQPVAQRQGLADLGPGRGVEVVGEQFQREVALAFGVQPVGDDGLVTGAGRDGRDSLGSVVHGEAA